MTTDQMSSANLSEGTSGGEDLLATLVGEGRKFKTVVDLARGKVEADSFIQKLADENKALRSLIQNADDSSRSTQVMNELLAKVSQGTLVQPNAEGEPKPNGGQMSNQPQALTSRDVELVFNNLRKKEREDANEQAAMQKLSAAYGDKTDEYLAKKARELELDVNVLKATARQSPTAFFNLIGENPNNKPTAGAPSVRGANTSAVPELANMGTEATRNAKYYEKLKSEMGVKKFMLDKSLQIQLHRDMMALGERWDGTP